MTQTTTAAPDCLHDVLTQTFGFPDYLPGQEAVVTRLVAGKSVLAVFPTGAGKSLCFQLPALLLKDLTLVISPLIALMKDQMDFLTSHGYPAGRLDSSLGRDETLKLYDALRSGQLKLLYVSPERLSNERFLKTLGRQKISLLAIDEAHCISEWGHNFRPDYLKLPRFARDFHVERVLALTATATPKVAQDICKAFSIAAEDVVHTGFYRPNLTLAVSPCTSDERDRLLLERLKKRAPGPTIVYVTLQHTSERVAEMLSRHGFNARAYHAGMKNEERDMIQDAFMASNNAIIVATIAFGMGVDKRNIRYVYHYNLPKSLESYSQEIGRAGRDGLESICELFACADDVTVLENFSYGDTPDREAIDALVAELLGQGTEFDISVYDLSGKHDVRPLVLKTLLTYLELKGILEATGPFFTEYKFQPNKPSDDIFARVHEERAEFLRKIFKHAKKGRTWYTLDTDAVAQQIGEPRDRIVAALGYLDDVGDIELQAAGVREGYRIKQRPADIAALCEELDGRFLAREQKDIGRLRQVLDMAQHDGCVTRYVLEYFGEKREDCGHCDHCRGRARAPLPPAHRKSADSLDRRAFVEVYRDNPAALHTPRQRARFLCGITSPATTRAKLKDHALFGALEGVPFHEVLAVVGA